MPIKTEDVKIKASQRMADTDDGGGFMTGREIVDGNINNAFNDISRLDRTVGRVSLRKMYFHVDTADTSMYAGAHIVLSNPAQDEAVSVCLFTTENAADTRLEAKNRLESYVTLGPRFQGWLYGDQPAGARMLMMFQPVSAPPPEIGEVLCLFRDKGEATEYRQYVRVMKCSAKTQAFALSGGGATRKVLSITISDPLEITFPGIEIMGYDNVPTNVYRTIASDAAKYYGVMLPSADIASGSLTMNVESIYTQLVPTSQSEDILADLRVAGITSSVPCGNTTIDVPSVPNTLPILVFPATRGNNYVANLWPPPAKGTVMVDYMAEGKWYRLKDNGNGILEPEIDGTGTGRVLDTGTVTITTAALPDVGTPIIIYWSNPTEIIDMSGVVDVKVDPIYHTLADFPIEPTSLRIAWEVGVSDTAEAIDDGHGKITLDGVEIGWINYDNGELGFTPPKLPVEGTTYKFNYRKYPIKQGTASVAIFTLPDQVKPGTLTLAIPVTTGGTSHTYHLRDNGSGKLHAGGYKQTLSQSRNVFGSNSSGSASSISNNSSESNTVAFIGGIDADIDYTNSNVVLDLSHSGGVVVSDTTTTISAKNGASHAKVTPYIPDFPVSNP